MRVIKVGLIGVFLSGISFSVTANDMADAVRQAIASHPKLAAEKADRNTFADQLGIEKAVNGPQVSLIGGIGREWSENSSTRNNLLLGGNEDITLTRKESGITITQDLFTGYLNTSKIAIAENNLITADSQLIMAREDLVIGVIKTYLDLYRARQVVQLAEENLDHHAGLLKDIKDKADSGTGNMADVSLARGRVALARSVLTRAIGDRAQGEVAYKEIVGTEASSLIKPSIATGTLPIDRDVALDIALDTHPALNGSAAQLEASKAAVRASKSAYYPKLWAEVGVNYSDDLYGTRGTNKDVSGMLRMSMNLFDGGARRRQVSKARNTMQRNGHLISEIERSIEKNVVGAWVGYTTQKDRLAALKDHASAAQSVFDAYKEQFSLGRRTLLDLMNARSETFTAQVNKVNGDFEYLLSQYEVLVATGNVSNSI